MTFDPAEDSASRYSDWEAGASLYVAVDILTHNDGIRHFGFEGHTFKTTRGLLVLVACALEFFHKTGVAGTSLDPSTIEDLAESFSFTEIHKRIV